MVGASIGDAYFSLGDYKKALKHFLNAKNNRGESAYENPFVMLRLGQLSLENHLNEDAKEYVLRAYMLEGKDGRASDLFSGKSILEKTAVNAGRYKSKLQSLERFIIYADVLQKQKRHPKTESI